MRRIAAAWLGLLAVVSLAAPALAGQPAAVTRSTLAVTGYAENGTRVAVIHREAHALTTVGVDGVTLRRSGAALYPVDAGVLTLERAAHREHVRAELLVSNYDGESGDFSSQIAARLLRSPANVDAVTTALARIVQDQHWDGIAVDLEALRAPDAPGLSRFVRLLQQKMPAARSVSVAMMASTDAGGYAERGYQLGPLAAAADVLALMAYDWHGPTWSGPGPIGPLRWQRAALAALLSKVPASKVDLGVAGYGYTWPPAPHRHDGRSVTDAQARRMVAEDGARARWVPRSGEWTATLHDGTLLWWSDGRSWPLRVDLAAHERLHGLALWRVGSADPLP